ncbi:peptidoglycan-binding domain-containing protein [Streptomyces sp. CA-111067]|uniref:peptidoglycan-binding domain-containing protein n=1 Tax=Streptomyces sp. CA-111067 TaxID=3240046 RepID=UPI003D982C50
MDANEAGEVRAAERAAHRAAAVAAAEGFHPLRVRPYVAEPDEEAAAGAADGGDDPATADLGLFPALYSAVEYAPDEAPAPAGPTEHVARGRHRRRRRRIVVAATAVAASALAASAVAVSGHMGSDEQTGVDVALPDQAASMPEVTLPADATQGTGSHGAALTHDADRSSPVRHTSGPTRPVTTSTPTSTPPSAPVTPAPPAAGPTAPAAPAATPPPATATAPTPTETATATTDAGTPTYTPSDAAASPAQVLSLGDRGAAVADLQQRLTHVWVYHGRADGDFDHQVQEAVAMFQVWYGVSGDPMGVYGPHTRAALDRAAH